MRVISGRAGPPDPPQKLSKTGGAPSGRALPSGKKALGTTPSAVEY